MDVPTCNRAAAGRSVARRVDISQLEESDRQLRFTSMLKFTVLARDCLRSLTWRKSTVRIRFPAGAGAVHSRATERLTDAVPRQSRCRRRR
ncbi:hypothetical protein MTO96_000265 [Rhipicephalus appendiculatus]